MILQSKIQNFDEPLYLESGRVFSNFKLAYETYGELNQDKSNVIVICHALTGSAHAAGLYEGDIKPGWWDGLIGDHKAVDTTKFFVICINILASPFGSTCPLDVDESSGREYRLRFPVVVVSDVVRAQMMLLKRLGIARARAVIGGSLGGMQALQWAIDYPDRVRHALVIASATRLSAQNIAFNDVARQAIITDPDFHEGHYRRFNTIPRRGLRIARMMGHITYLAEEGLGRKFGRSLHDGIRYGYGVEFEIESYLRYQGDKFAERFDANTYLRMTKVLDYFSPAAAFGNDLVAALRQTKAKFFVASFTTDWRFAPARSRALVKHLVKAGRDVQYIEVESNHGHDAFLMTDRPYIAAVAAYMDNVYKELQA